MKSFTTILLQHKRFVKQILYSNFEFSSGPSILLAVLIRKKDARVGVSPLYINGSRGKN